MIKTGHYILIGFLHQLKYLIKIAAIITAASFILSAIFIGAFVAIAMAGNYITEHVPILRIVGQIIFGILTFSIPVWIFITQPLYEKGREIEKQNKTPK